MQGKIKIKQLTILLVLIMGISVKVKAQTVNNVSQMNQKLKKQYILDLVNLADYIKQYPSKQINTSKLPANINNVWIASIQMFQQKRIELAKGQQAELSYPFLNYISDIKIKQSILTEQLKSKFTQSRRHYQTQPQDYLNLSLCKIQDPQIQAQTLAIFPISFSQDEENLGKQSGLKSYLIKLDKEGYYQLYIVNGQYIQVYKIQAIAERQKAGVKILHKINIQQLINTRFRKIFIFQLQGQVTITNGQSLYSVNNGSIQMYATLRHKIQNTSDEGQQQNYNQILKILSLKHGILVQYQNFIGIFVEGRYLPQNLIGNTDRSSTSIQFFNVLDQISLYKLSKQHKILDVEVVTYSLALELKKLTSARLSNIFVSLVIRYNFCYQGVIQLVYGSYGQINQYSVPYGHLKQFQVFSQTFQIIFQQSHNRQSRTYIAEMYLNKTNRLEPQLMINRFYDNQRQISQLQYWDGQIYFIGPNQITIQGPSINSQMLISQNISQFPYKIPLLKTEIFSFLQHYSTPKADIFISINRKEIKIIKTKRQNQKIVCKSAKEFDLRVQIIGSCCKNYLECESQQIWKQCRYEHNIRTLIINQSSNKIFSMIRYLIILLIVLGVVALLLILNNIKKNTKILDKVKSIRKKIDDKYRQMQAKHNKNIGKGQKIHKDEEQANGRQINFKQNSCKEEDKNQASQRQQDENMNYNQKKEYSDIEEEKYIEKVTSEAKFNDSE